MPTIDEIKTKFCKGEIDIKYRFLKGNKKWTGWRSFRKTDSQNRGAMWPWDIPAAKVEWQIVE